MTVTLGDISLLLTEACEAGDQRQVDLCELVLAGAEWAFTECERVILTARAAGEE